MKDVAVTTDQPRGAVVQGVAFGARGSELVSRVGQIGNSVAHGLPLLGRFFGTVLRRH